MQLSWKVGMLAAGALWFDDPWRYSTTFTLKPT
jgi:hypothetical protein